MKKKERNLLAPKRYYFKLPSPKTFSLFKRKHFFSLPPVLPQLLVIAICLCFYYAMIRFYLFFTWGFYLYYLLKLIIAYEILSASRFSLWVPLGAFLLGSATLVFTNSLFLTTFMNRDTAWQLFTVGLIGLMIALFRSHLTRDAK